MAITRRWQTGAELNDYWAEIDASFTAGTGVNEVISTDPATGTYHFRTYANGSSDGWFTKNFPATYQGQIAFRMKGIPYASSPVIKSFSVYAGGTELFSLIFDWSGNAYLYIGVTQRDTGTIATAWKHIGIDFKIDGSNGWVNVYKDGVLWMDYSGNTGTAQATVAFFGKKTTNSATINYYWDDIYMNDTTGEGSASAPPMYKFPLVVPNGNGNYSQFDGSDGNSVDNYALVDEIPPSQTDYIYTVVADEFDSFAMSTLTLAAGEAITAIIPTVSIKKAGATEQAAFGTRLSGTDSIGSDQNPSTASTILFERQTTKPGGGSWSQADLDSVEVVIKSRGSY